MNEETASEEGSVIEREVNDARSQGLYTLRPMSH